MKTTERSKPFFCWDGDDDPTRLIENILPLLSKFSNVPVEKLKDMVSTAALKTITEKYRGLEFTITFDENGMFHLRQNDDEFLPILSSGIRSYYGSLYWL